MFSTRICARAKVLCTSLIAFALLAIAQSSYAQVSVTATAGTPGPTSYTTLKAAFDAVNAGTHQGVVTIEISANTTETATAQINAGNVLPASYTSVYVKPATGTTPTVTGAIASNPIIKFYGASNVTIDGSNNGSSTRDLSITNTSTVTSQVVQFGSVGTTPMSGDTVKNCILTNGTQGSSAVVAYNSVTVPAASGGYFNNITIRNNSIRKAYIGVYLFTAVAAGNGSGILVTGNDLVSTGANAIRLCGLYAQGLDGVTISNNNVGNFETTSVEYDRGIWLATGTSNATVSGNTITGLSSTATGNAPFGISVSTGNTAANINVSGNAISNLSSASSVMPIGIYVFTAVSGVTIQKNSVSNIKNTNTGGFGSAGILLASTLTAANTTASNNFVWDIASYGFNGFTSADNGNGIVLDAGGGYNIYHNTVALTTNQTLAGGQRSAAMLVTSNITAANSVNIRNNIFANFQTVGNANSRFAMVSTANNNVYTSLDYNDYYSASGNLTSKGSNATIETTIPGVQTSLGGNGASVSIQPVFASLTDLHLTAANTTLNNLGTPIAGITTDIDGDARSATTPDMGADEFLTCPAIAFTGPIADTACIGGQAFFTAASTSATAWQWQLNTGAGWTNITNNATYSGATTATLTVSNATTAMAGYQYRAYATSACANDTSAVVALAVSPVPASPTITSNSPVCGGGTINLTAGAVAAGGTVTWDGPGNFTANGTTATRTNAAVAMTGPYIAITTVQGCGSVPTTTTVTVNPTPVIASATGTNPSTCGGANGSVALSGLATSTAYTATYSLGGVPQAPVTLTSNSSGVLTIPGLGNGTYSAFAVSAAGCPSAAFAGPVTLNGPGTPPQPSAIAGQTTGCTGVGTTYSVTPFTGATYTWTLPPGWTGSSTTSSITATAGAGAGAGTISVTASNTCGTSAAQTLAVNVASVPVAPGIITGTSANCAGVANLFSVQPVTGATGYAWTLPSGWSGTSSTFSISATPGSSGGLVSVVAQNVCGNSAPSTLAVTSNPAVSPAVSVSPSTPTTICAGTPVTFTAVPTNGGTTPTYHWLKNGVSTGTYTATYANSTLAAGDVIQVTMTSSAPCPLPSPTVSGSITMTVQPTTLTGVNINANFVTAPVVCVGTPVTFIANVTGGGTLPAYQWRVNGAPVGTNTATYTTSALASGDSVMCVVTSSATCPSPSAAMSNKIGLEVVTSIEPQIAITASPDTTMALGQPVTFTATVVGDGPTPGYQWFKNGVGTGATGPSYTTTAWTSGDEFFVRMVSSMPCASPTVASSNTLRMTGTTSIASAVAGAGLSLWPNPTTGRFTLALFNTPANLRTRIEILNALGQVVYHREVLVDRKDWSTEIELGAGIADGIYLLRLTGEDGARSTERFELRR